MIAQIEKRLRELVPSGANSLMQAARYSLFSSGKRLRPQLVLALVESLAPDKLPLAIDPACAIEMVHTYSLIHDDLPCMDDDDLRRGAPALHIAFPEATALLTGDYLLTYAFEVLTKAPDLSKSQKFGLIEVLSHRAGAQGMIGGQMIDIESKGSELSETDLLTMHKGKTAALFTACLEFGAIIAKKPKDQMEELGKELGIAYQIVDDLLDATSTTTALGKTAGSDIAHEKPNAVSIYGIEGAQHKLKTMKDSVLKKCESFPSLLEVVKKLLQRNY